MAAAAKLGGVRRIGKTGFAGGLHFSGNLCQNVLQHYARSGSPKASTKVITRNIYNAVTGRLSEVKMSTDGGVFESIASYQYNELGQVSKKITGGGAEEDNLEYNIRGQLTGVNTGHTSGIDYPEQHFGYKLSYEYGHSEPRYDGSISGFIWRGSGRPQSYGYQYDDAGRMTAADYTEFSNVNYTGNAWNNQNIDYSVSQVAYDANGNMLSMKQRGVGVSGGVVQPVDMDRLRYNYPIFSNRLASVKDTVTIDYQLHDFLDGSTGSRDYGYDADGNLSVDLNKGITDITYNELDLPLSVSTVSNGSISNVYDAGGALVEKTITFPSGSAPATNPWVYRYVGPFVYRNDSLLYFHHSEGRARYLFDSAKFKNDFYLKDHLGNVRMTVVSDVSAQATDYLATHEVASANTENLVFENIDKVRDNSNWGPGQNNWSSIRLNGGVDSTRIGTAILLNVMAGDNFELAVHAYYNAGDSNMVDYTDGYSMVESLLTALGGSSGPGGPDPGDGPGGPGGPGGGTYGALQMLLSGSNYDGFDAVKQTLTDATQPRAFINYMLFDEQMQLVADQSGAVQVTSASADNWSVIGTSGAINVKNNGYLLVYLSAEQIRDVYFDDLHVLHKRGRLLEENHYYPHGLTIRAGSSNPVPTREGYQGKELQDEVGMELYDFHARQYDPQIGRFWGVDPADQFPSGYTGMGNNPANMIDPTGMVAQASGNPGSTLGNDARIDPHWKNLDDDSWRAEDDEFLTAHSGGGGSSADQPAQGSEEAPTEYTYNEKGELIKTVENDQPDKFFIEETKTEYVLGLIPIPAKITAEISLDAGIGLMARITYGEMNIGSDGDMAVVAESVRNRLARGGFEAGDGTYSGVIQRFYDAADPTNADNADNYSRYTDPRSYYRNVNNGAAGALGQWHRSMGAAIRAAHGSDVGQGVIFYNTSSATYYDGMKNYVKLDPNPHLQLVLGTWKVKY